MDHPLGEALGHLPQALDLALARPIVTAELPAQELKVSARAGQILIAELGLRELTGRESGEGQKKTVGCDANGQV